MYAIYSKKQSEYGYFEYKRANGDTVFVTEVSEDPSLFKTSTWDDKVDMGEVVRFVRNFNFRRSIFK